MKKFLVLFFALFMICLASMSCRKCVTCKAYYHSNDSLIDEDEFCGSNKSIEEQQDFYMEWYNLEDDPNDNYDTYVECI